MDYGGTKIEPPEYTFIPGGLNIGAHIIIRGRVAFDQARFFINLQNEKKDGCDVAFNFTSRADNKTVVRNSFKKGWQVEETDIPCFPFTSRSNFTIRIYVGPGSFLVLVNGRYFIEYKHRLPFRDVRYLKLSKGAEYYESTIDNPYCTPYKEELPGGFKMGKALRVRGFVNDNADRFAIHFNAVVISDVMGIQFKSSQDENDRLLNTRIDSWQHEKKGIDWFPLTRGQYFDVLYIASNDRLNIYVNDTFFTTADFFIPPEDICYLDIDGDVTLIDIEFTDLLPGDYVKVIPLGLEKNDLVVVKGFFYRPEGERFAINLINGTSHDDDVALHFNPRRDQNEVVLNSRKGEKWQKEEKHRLPPVLSDMIPFEVEIVAKSEKFKIYLNGNTFASFKARGDVHNIKGINVRGGAYFYEVKLLRRVLLLSSTSVKENTFVDKVTRPLEPGSWATGNGTPKSSSNKAAINLQCEDNADYGCDVAFHFNRYKVFFNRKFYIDYDHKFAISHAHDI